MAKFTMIYKHVGIDSLGQRLSDSLVIALDDSFNIIEETKPGSFLFYLKTMAIPGQKGLVVYAVEIGFLSHFVEVLTVNSDLGCCGAEVIPKVVRYLQGWTCKKIKHFAELKL
jgi:hypothetical protein